ncbi:MAG TPA: TetR/AcrR family transcriptional regulator [Rhodoblastus sp.]|nr:TetR/AcrR family transcriptional regulator [Rhodoblastus sp.]
MRNDTEIEKRKRGRPRQFDTERVLESVRAVFIEKGYAGASLDDLAAAAGLNRPSLYGAFGDKEQLYIQTLKQLGDRSQARLGEILARGEPIEERLTAVYRSAIAAYSAPPLHAGCMIVNTAATAATTHPAIAEAAREIRAETEAMFERAFAACVARRELPAEPAPSARAKLATAMLDTLAVRARLGERAASLEAFAQEALALVCVI